MALARFSRSSFSSFRSKWAGGKKTADCGPRHAALACHRSSCICALIGAPSGRWTPSRPRAAEAPTSGSAATAEQHPVLAVRPRCLLAHGDPPLAVADHSADPLPATRGELSRATPPDLLFCVVTTASLTGVAGAAGLRFDFEQEPVDPDDPDALAGGDGRRPVRTGPPGGAADLHRALGREIGEGGAELAHHPLAADGGRGEAGTDQRGHAAD